MGKVEYEIVQNMKQAFGVKVTEKNLCVLCVEEMHKQQYRKLHNPYFLSASVNWGKL